MLITFVCPVSSLKDSNRIKAAKQQRNEQVRPTKNVFTKQSQAVNRGGIVEGLGFYQQSSETPTNTTKLLI